MLLILLQAGVSYLHSIMSTSSDVVNDTSTRAPVDDGRGTAMSSPVPQSSATRPTRAKPSPPAHKISSESNDESTSTQLQLDGDALNVEEIVAGKFQCAVAVTLYYYMVTNTVCYLYIMLLHRVKSHRIVSN